MNSDTLFRIKKTNTTGTTYPADLINLSYEDSIAQLNLLEEVTLHADFKSDRQGEDVLCRNYTDGSFELFEIEEEI